MNKIIYLASGTANINGYDIVYQDINGKRDLGGDMLDISLDNYDILIATPPCNFYSRANWRRYSSSYSLNTRHLLPSIIKKFESTGKPFIVENVRSPNLFKSFINELEITTLVIYYGRHTYFTNINFIPKSYQELENIQYIAHGNYFREGSDNVNRVIKEFLDIVCKSATSCI